MQFHKISIPVVFISFFLIIISGCENEEVSGQYTVANIEDITSIEFSELHTFYNNNHYNRRFPDDTMRGYNEALDHLLLKRLKQIDFINSGMHNNDDLMKGIARKYNEEVIVEYFNEAFLSKYINEESIRDYYDDMSKEVTYRQIVIKKPENMDQSMANSLSDTLASIRRESAENENFGELVARYSQHQESAQNEGYMPVIDWRNGAKSRKNQLIFNMNEGDIQVMEVGREFNIIKVEEVKNVDIPPLEAVRNDIEDNLRQLYLDQSLEEYTDLKNSIVDSQSMNWNEDALDQLTDWARQSDFYEELYQDTLQNAIDEDDNKVILTYSDGQVDYEEYLRLLNEVLIPGKPSDISKEDIKRFIDDAVRTDLIIKKAKEENYHDTLLTANTPSSVLRYEFERLYNNRKITSQIPEPSEEALTEFYESHKDSLLYQFPKVIIYANIFDEQEQAEELWNNIQQGQTFEEANNRTYKVRTFIKNKDGEIDSHLRAEKPYLGEVAFSLEEGELTGPVEYVDDENGVQYAVVKCSFKEEGRLLEFSEVEDLEEKYRKYHRDSLSKVVKQELEDKYSVAINHDVLEENVSNLN